MGFKYVDLDELRKKKEAEKEVEKLGPTEELGPKIVEFVENPEPKTESSTLYADNEPTEVKVEQEQIRMAKVVNVDRLRIRLNPDGKILGTIDKGVKVKVIGNDMNGWTKVVSPMGMEGWCMTEYLLTYWETKEVTVNG